MSNIFWKSLSLYSSGLTLWAFILTIIIYKLGINKLKFKKNILYISTFFCLYILLIVLFKLLPFPYSSDDYFFYNKATNENLDFLKLIKKDYFNYNGRVVVLFFAYFFNYFNVLFKIIAPFIYLIYMYFIYKIISCISGKKGLPWFLLVFFVVYSSNPNFMDSTLWISGASTYLMTSTCAVIFIYIYVFDYTQNVIKNQYGIKSKASTSFFIFLFGLINGWGVENTAASIFIIMTFILLTQLLLSRNNKNISKTKLWQLMGYLGVLIGIIMALLSPGNKSRIEIIRGSNFDYIENVFDLSKVKLNFMFEISKYFSKGINSVNYAIFGNQAVDDKLFLSFSSLTFILVILVFFFFRKHILNILKTSCKSNSSKLYLYLAIITGALISYYSLIFTPNYFPSRALAFPTALQTIITIIFIVHIWNTLILNITEALTNNSREKLLIYLNKCIQTVHIYIFCLSMLIFFDNYKDDILNTWFWYDANRSLVSYIKSEKAKGNLDIVVPRNLNSKIFFLYKQNGRRRSDGLFYPEILNGATVKNGGIAEYYGLKSFRLAPLVIEGKKADIQWLTD